MITPIARGIAVGAFVVASLATLNHLVFAKHYKHGDHGHHGTEHDEVNMPGLRGANASQEESDELRLLFRNFETINRQVTNLPDGIRTVTWSTETEVMNALTSHAVGMIDRVKRLDNPKILIQSPTLDSFFLHGDEITSDITFEDERLVVTQTSKNPELVEALQTHAAEVTAMSDRGMDAVHEMIMKTGKGH